MGHTKITNAFSKFGSTKLIIIILVFCVGAAFAVSAPNVVIVTPTTTSEQTPTQEIVTTVGISKTNEVETDSIVTPTGSTPGPDVFSVTTVMPDSLPSSSSTVTPTSANPSPLQFAVAVVASSISSSANSTSTVTPTVGGLNQEIVSPTSNNNDADSANTITPSIAIAGAITLPLATTTILQLPSINAVAPTQSQTTGTTSTIAGSSFSVTTKAIISAPSAQNMVTRTSSNSVGASGISTFTTTTTQINQAPTSTNTVTRVSTTSTSLSSSGTKTETVSKLTSTANGILLEESKTFSVIPISSTVIGSISEGDDLSTTQVTKTTTTATSQAIGPGFASVADVPVIVDDAVVYKVVAGPTIVSVTAEDANGDGIFSSNDIITMRFSENTNEPPVATTTQINSLLSITSLLGTSYSGSFFNPSTLIITIDDAANGNPTPGVTTFTINSNGNLQNSAKTSLNSTDTATLGGTFTTQPGPFITAFVIEDPDNDNPAFSAQDKFTIKFSEPTNKAGGANTLDKDGVSSIFSFSNNLGLDYTGEWVTDSTFQITSTDSFGGSPVISSDGVTGTTVTVAGSNLKNSAGTSLDSDSTSPELIGSFGRFSEVQPVIDGGSAITTLPSGIDTQIQLPDGTSTQVTIETIEINTEPELFTFSLIGETVNIETSSSTACSATCTVSFTFTQQDIPSGLEIKDIRIVTDANDDGDFEDEGEQLDTTIVENPPGFFTASATADHVSSWAVGGVKSLALGALAGGGGSSNAPQIGASQALIFNQEGGQFGVSIADINLNDITEPWTLSPGDKLILRFDLYENQGINSVAYVALFLDAQGFASLQKSATYIAYEPFKPLVVSDPYGYFADAGFALLERDATNFVAKFDITFAKPMEQTDMMVRTWDLDRNAMDAFYQDVLKVTLPEPSLESETELKPIAEAQPTITVPDWIRSNAKWWNEGYITDIDFAKGIEYLIQNDIVKIPMSTLTEGFGAQPTIPNWVKSNAGWWSEGLISTNDFVNGIKFLVENGIIRV